MKKAHGASADPAARAACGQDPGGGAAPQAYAFGPFRLVPGERILRRGEQPLPLPPKAFEALLLLVRNAGHVMRKQDLLDALWPETFVEEVNLANRISVLRKALGDAGPDWTYIQTVSRLGYRFLPAVTRIWSDASRAPGGPARERKPSGGATRFIALPFEIAGSGEGLGFLAASLPEAVSASLAGLPSLTVRSSLLAARLAEGPLDPRRVAEAADVDVVLTGRIVCDGGRLRVSTELVEAATATVVGSFSCHAARENVFEIQDSLVLRIVELLLPRLGEHESGSFRRDVPRSAGAYEFYLRAAHLERLRTVENMCVSRDLYRQSLEEDPDYAPAWARLGRCYAFLEKFDPGRSVTPDQTQWAFRRAFALNPDLPLAHHHYTHVEADSGHAQNAMVRLLGQVRKYPNDPELFCGLVQATRYCGLLDASLAAHRRARGLDPRAVTSAAHTYFLLGDYEKALEWYPPGSRYYLDAAVLASMGRDQDALAVLRERQSLSPLVQSLRLCLEGEHGRCIETVRRCFAEHPGPDPEVKFYLARHLARSGAPDEALNVIAGLVDEDFFCSAALARDPWLRPLEQLAACRRVMEDVLRREEGARSAFESAGGGSSLAKDI